ncbi:MAG: ATP-binding protein [Chloroflexota bacterium]|nr:ATP-binding protein [Chloroflexota bacterium]
MARRPFLNRTEELGGLQRRWDSGEAQLFTLWGRRRVGKTLLLLELARGKRHLYFEATSGTRADQLADFSGRLAEATGRAALSVPDWRRGLDALADWAEEGPVLLVLDEFQFIARENQDIGSIINVWWRERGEGLPIFLVLSGSEVGFFEREVVNYSATTYGRRAGQLRLRPFKPHDVDLFLPGWSAEDKVAAYAVFGHMPYYLAQVREQDSLAENILNLVLRPDGLLHEEARLLLVQELAEPSAYFSVLRAIAAGQTKVSEIAQRTGMPGGTSRVSQMLDTLRNLWLVEKLLPVTVTNPERSKQSRYRITDPYLRFWFRFVLPAQGRLADDEGAERHLRGQVLPHLHDFVAAPAFEEICQQWLRSEIDAATVGWWWGKVRETRGAELRAIDRELDAVAIGDEGHVIAVGSCKWTASPLPDTERIKLEVLSNHLAPDGPQPKLYFFARNGFDDDLTREADRQDRIHLVSPAELFPPREV